MHPIGEILAATIDCAEPERLAEFWSEVVGGVIDDRTRGSDWVALCNVPTLGNLGFQKVPEPKQVKNRVHLDIEVVEIETAAARIRHLGGSTLTPTIEEPEGGLLHVLADPEGNEFCLITRATSS